MSLIDEIEKTLQKTKIGLIVDIAKRHTEGVEELIQLSFHHNQQIAFRAAWILEQIYANAPEQFARYIPTFLENYVKLENLSAKRHYAKILAFATHQKAHLAVREKINQIDLAPVVETTFDWLVNEHTPVAIKSHCLNILANLVPRYTWIKDELVATMEYLVDQESIAFFAKVKQIRKQLIKS